MRNSLELFSSLKGGSWHSNAKIFQQLKGLGQISSRAIYLAGIRSIEELRQTDDSKIEILLKRNPPFGRNLKRSIDEKFPKIHFDCSLDEFEVDSKKLNVTIKTENNFKCLHQDHLHLLVIAYKSESSGRILFHHQFNSISIFKNTFTHSIDISNKEKDTSFSCSLMFEGYSGLNQNICFNVKQKFENTINNLDEFDISLSDIEQEVSKKELNNSTKLPTNIQTNPVNIPPSPLSTTYTPPRCKHTCKDKLSCAHICCKAGQLKRPPAADPLIDSKPPTKKSSTSLAGSKRSLTNLREYLQKYQPVNLRNPSNTLKLIPVITDLNETDELYDEIELVLRYFVLGMIRILLTF